MGVDREDFPDNDPAGTIDENDAKSAQARLNGIRKFKKDRKQRRHEEATKVATPSSAPRRDSLSGLREAARKRRGAA